MVHILILQTVQKKKKSTLKTKNEDDKCFQYAVVVALNYAKFRWNRERISNIYLFINKYNHKLSIKNR